MASDSSRSVDRRAVLASLGVLAGAAAVAGWSTLDPVDDAETTELPATRARKFAERFAPTLYFDAYEKWFPTDPRRYESQRDGDWIVDGFDAFDGYSAETKGSSGPPAPTLFYHVVRYEESPLAVVQYWSYSAFDQFTTNFHWHDWELLQVFVDTDTGEPQLYAASAHSRRVPNNEFLDPVEKPRILSELGSHSSALSVNAIADRFQRLPLDGLFADITNSPIETLDSLLNIPIAYGLPRDEGSRLPFLVPELDGAAIYDHERLPSVDRTDLIDDDLTVRSFGDLTSPPVDLPERATGLVFGYAGRETEDELTVDVDYDLVSTDEIEHITAFTGPQLSFEFAVPGFAEDAIAGHITTTGVPWTQPRYTEPAVDITDASHRAALADRYDVIGPPVSIETVVATVSEAVSAPDAPDGEGLTTQSLSVEALALLESDPEAVPTFDGVAVIRDVPDGDHRLTINAPGVAPHSETLSVAANEPGVTAAGVDGQIPLVARENAVKLAVDTAEADSELAELAIEDDFAGRLYEAPLVGQDAVYVHRGGAYTTEVRDVDGEIGVSRVTPADERRVQVEPRTGKAALAAYIAAVAEETSVAVAAVDRDVGVDSEQSDEDAESDSDRLDTGSDAEQSDAESDPEQSDADSDSETPLQGLSRALDAVAEAAQQATERAEAGESRGTDRSLATVQDRLNRVSTRLTEASEELPDDLEAATERRLEQLRRRTDQAQAAEKL